ncbi:MAG: aldolase, partial [Candidatus Omnitrophica bacterium]|nr:aldolase [Candidatus Omnitrophota bacterium]
MVYQNEAQIFDGKTLIEKDGKIEIKNPDFFRKKIVDDLIDTIILSDSAHLKRLCYFVAYNAGIAFGVIPSSIQGLYEARGKDAFSGFTVPAINIRTLTY